MTVMVTPSIASSAPVFTNTSTASPDSRTRATRDQPFDCSVVPIVADLARPDGATAFVRPIRPDDAPLIVDFHSRQSPESIYFRYFSPRPRLSEDEVLTRVMLTQSAIKRLVEPDEVASAVLYLCTEDTGFMTGTNLVIDGGWSAH